MCRYKKSLKEQKVKVMSSAKMRLFSPIFVTAPQKNGHAPEQISGTRPKFPREDLN